MRYGPQYGPDIIFLGVDRCDWSDAASYSDADVVILGAPFDGGTSYRSGTRFGPQYIRQASPHDHAEITSFLANRVVLETLSGIARRRLDVRDGSSWDRRQPLLDNRPVLG